MLGWISGCCQRLWLRIYGEQGQGSHGSKNQQQTRFCFGVCEQKFRFFRLQWMNIGNKTIKGTSKRITRCASARLFLRQVGTNKPTRIKYLCKRSLSDVNRRYSDTFRPVMSTRTSPVTTFMTGGRPPTPLGQEKPAPCMEQVHRTGSWTEGGRGGGDVTGSAGATCERSLP